MSGLLFASHSLCGLCFHEHRPDADPITVRPEFREESETCCGCGKEHQSGIYYRGAVKDFPFCACIKPKPPEAEA